MNWEYINNEANWWIPVLVFFTIVGFFIFLGSVWGIRTSIYFLSWNVVGLILAILVTPYLWGIAKTYSSENIAKVVNNFSNVLGAFLILPFLLFVNFIAFLIYWFFRRFLKKTIRENKESNISNFSQRIIGASIGVICSVPIAATATNIANISSTQNQYSKFNDTLIKAITFGKYNGISSESKAIADLLKIITDDQFVDTLEAIFNYNSADDDANKESYKTTFLSLKDKLENIFNSSLLDGAIGMISQNIKSGDLSNAVNHISDIKEIVNTPIVINSASQLDTIRNTLMKEVEKVEVGNENLSNQVDTLLNSIFTVKQ